MQNSEIIISLIHSSEIVLAGLSEIIEDCCDCKVQKTKNIDELSGYPNFKGCHLMLLPEKYYKKNSALLDRLFVDASAVEYLFVEKDNTKNSLQIIGIDDSIADISLKMSEMMKRFDKQSAVNEQHTLTERETDVLRLIVKGFRNKEVADKLFISTHTVVTHRKNITEKLNIKSISGLTVYAALKKIIDLDEIDLKELI